jgi:hypothetical protein
MVKLGEGACGATLSGQMSCVAMLAIAPPPPCSEVVPVSLRFGCTNWLACE